MFHDEIIIYNPKYRVDFSGIPNMKKAWLLAPWFNTQ